MCVGIDGASIPRQAVTVKGVKEIKSLIPTYRDHTSLLAIVSAAGVALPPLFVFKGMMRVLIILSHMFFYLLICFC